MEEFARSGFPNQHTTHRDTRYICMQTFVSARGPGDEGDGGNETGKTYRGGRAATPRSRASASVVRAACIHIYMRAECKARARAHCERMRGIGVCKRVTRA